ncbi:MAG: peptidase M55 [Planctomycetaceae bacterium]|nr:MAG: peptidase M55 [Planctomycetaceae bacterium]
MAKKSKRPLKFAVAVDCEGVACVVGAQGMGLGDTDNWEMARRQATREADAAAKGLFDAGASEVIVWDNHSRGLNLHYDDLDQRCQIALGAGGEGRWPGVDSTFAGVLLIGYHAMDTTVDAILAHTFSSREYQWIKVGGREVGEMAIDASLAGERKVPVIFVASDDKGVAEAKKFMPWVQTVATKRGLARNQAISKHPLQAAAEIRQGAAAAVARLDEMKTFHFPSPTTLEYRFKILDGAQAQARKHAGWTRTDPYTCQKKINKLSDEF